MDTPADHQNHKQGPVLAAVRNLAAETRQLFEQRDHEYERIQTEHETSKRSANERFERSTTDARSERDAALSEARERERFATERAEAELGARLDEQRKQRDALTAELDEAAAERREQIEKEHREARWLSETVAESDERQANAHAAAIRKRTDATRDAIAPAPEGPTTTAQTDTLIDAVRNAARDTRVPATDTAIETARERARDEGTPPTPTPPTNDQRDDDEPRILSASQPAAPQPRHDRTPAERFASLADGERAEAEETLAQLRRLRTPSLARGWAALAMAGAIAAAPPTVVAITERPLPATPEAVRIAAAAAVGLATAAAINFLFRRIADTRARRLAADAAYHAQRALMACEASANAAETAREKRIAETRERRETEKSDADRKRQTRLARLEEQIANRREQAIEPLDRSIDQQQRELDKRKDEARREREQAEHDAKRRFNDSTVDARATRDDAIAQADHDRDTALKALVSHWRTESDRLAQEADRLEAITLQTAPPWDDPSWEAWQPTNELPPCTPVGTLTLDLNTLTDAGDPPNRELAWPGRAVYRLPAPLESPGTASLLIESTPSARDRAIAAARGAVTRLLTTHPPGKVRFTLIDPVGLGQSFAAFMHLADHEETLVSSRIWTEPRHIEQRLLDLTEHMENVIQKYLRNEFETIEQYNEQAGEIAEPYRVLVIADFPNNISDTAARRLASIVNSGSRCGVHTITIANPDEQTPKGIERRDLHNAALTITTAEQPYAHTPTFRIADTVLAELPYEPPAAPDDRTLTRLLNAIGSRATDASRVQVPFEAVAPSPGERFTLSSADGVSVPLGRSGATKLQRLTLGEGTLQHALIAGKTGSGKSTLLHVLITSAALWYDPDELNLYLVDFKKGVEFKTYATHRTPHARVIAVETDREFGLSVLQRLDEILKERGELFRHAGAQSIADYRKETGETLPRALLIIDEFQELFTEDDRVAQEAALLLDRLVRQGRAFGVHVILGSQTLGGAYSIARATMAQMNVRIALQCDEQDSYIILNEDNSAARLLERPGEAVYNDAGGRVEGNSVFQIVWLPANRRDRALDEVLQLTRSKAIDTTPAVVFEGNAPARPENNPAFEPPRTGVAPATPLRIPLGEPTAIAPPVDAALNRRSGANLLIVGQQQDTARNLMLAAALAFAARAAGEPAATLYILDGAHDDEHRDQTLEATAARLPIECRTGKPRDAPRLLEEVAAELDRRRDLDLNDQPPVLILVHALQRFRDLRRSDDFSFSFSGDAQDQPDPPDKLLARILEQGPDAGIHTALWCDSATNLERALERRTLREFDHRVLFQMSAMDSTNLIDSPDASRLGQHRALLYTDEDASTRTLRPYGEPEKQWLEERLNANSTGRDTTAQA